MSISRIQDATIKICMELNNAYENICSNQNASDQLPKGGPLKYDQNWRHDDVTELALG